MTDPGNITTDQVRAFRGGSWASTAEECRSANRDWDSQSFVRNLNYGFRVCLSPSGK